MLKSSITGSTLILAVAAFSAISFLPATDSAAAPSTEVTRKMLMQQDLPIDGYSMATVAVEIPVGGREGRHSHPGALSVYMLEGAIALDYEGKPTMTYKAGDTFFVEANKIHEGINNGNVSAKAIATFVVPKGQPITKQAE